MKKHVRINLLRQLRHPVPPPPSRDITWHVLKASWITPVGTAQTKSTRDIYVPMPKSMPVAALFSAPAAARPAPTLAATPPKSVSNPPIMIPSRVSREIEHAGYVKMPGRMLGETRAMREASRKYVHRHCLPLTMKYAALWCQCWQLANQPIRSSVNRAPRKTRWGY